MRRRGFTLAEVLVSLGLIAVLAAVVVPTIRGRLQDGYEDAIVSEFTSLASAINAYRQDVGHYPPRLDYLTILPASPDDFCGRNLSTSDSAKWRGPYVSRTITTAASYVVFQKDSVQDALARPIGNPNVIQVVISGADTATARGVDLKIDGAANQAAGTLLWSATGTGAVLSYSIPTRNGAC
ncbi:MAG TPA: prepilin-type N-terminal cleavage/methylation domain-containing protein [Gemmatimonadaceae bacterium]